MSTKKKATPKKPADDWTKTPPADGRRVRRLFTNDVAREIRQAHANGWAVAALARKFNTSRYTITCIVRGITYPDAGGPVATPVSVPA